MKLPGLTTTATWCWQGPMLAFTAMYWLVIQRHGWREPLLLDSICLGLSVAGFYLFLPALCSAETAARNALARRLGAFAALFCLSLAIAVGVFGWNNRNDWFVPRRSLSDLLLDLGVGLFYALLPILFFAALRVWLKEDADTSKAIEAHAQKAHWWAQGASRLLLRFGRELHPAMALRLGSVLVLASYLLPFLLLYAYQGKWDIGNDSFWSSRWITAEVGYHELEAIERYAEFGLPVYFAGMVFALLTLLLHTRMIRGSGRLAGRAWRVPIAVLSYAFLQFSVWDVLFFQLVGTNTAFEIAGIILFLIFAPLPLFLWFRLASSGKESRGEEWPRQKSAIVAAHFPVLMGTMLTLALALIYRAFHYVFNFAGIALLFWGYAQLVLHEAPAECSQTDQLAHAA